MGGSLLSKVFPDNLFNPQEFITHISALIQQLLVAIFAFFIYYKSLFHVCQGMNSLRTGNVWCIFCMTSAWHVVRRCSKTFERLN